MPTLKVNNLVYEIPIEKPIILDQNQIKEFQMDISYTKYPTSFD